MNLSCYFENVDNLDIQTDTVLSETSESICVMKNKWKSFDTRSLWLHFIHLNEVRFTGEKSKPTLVEV